MLTQFEYKWVHLTLFLSLAIYFFLLSFLFAFYGTEFKFFAY